MPTITSYLNGMSSGMGGGNPTPSKRGEVVGWSQAAVRRHTRWLYSVDGPALTGTGFAATLTIRDIPPSSEAFHAARDALVKRLARSGLERYHWVIEWTERKRPHLHMALYWPGQLGPNDQARIAALIVTSWMEIASEWGTGSAAQHVARIDGALGWLQYLSKHAARGASHYQRQGKPSGWEKTGRLWGKGGDWPAEDPMTFDVSRQGFWRYRRLVRSWRVADARAALAAAGTPKEISAARRRLVAARSMLRCSSRKLSEVRGVSEWVGESAVAQLLGLLAGEGHTLAQR